MSAVTVSMAISSLTDLRRYVHQILCQRENLLEDQSPLGEQVLMRGGVECGRQFILHGPRAVRLSAIWAMDSNTLFFYDTRGERFLKVALEQRLAIAA